MKEAPIICERGFHFCEKVSDCFNYYEFTSDNHVAEIEALGEVVTDNNGKSCTNKISIISEIPWCKVQNMVNEGKDCAGPWNSGNGNSGSCNSGCHNSGCHNSGSQNSGSHNSGSWNSGDYNSGNGNSGNGNSGIHNSGNYNSGNYNSGDYNSGNGNSGDWNKSSFNNGCFMTNEPKIMMFNKPSNWTYEDWLCSYARSLLNQIPRNVVKWIYSVNMTDEEKAEHPEHETTGGYLKILDESECGQLWWNGLGDCDKQKIFDIPNFDAEIFERCTGIAVSR